MRTGQLPERPAFPSWGLPGEDSARAEGESLVGGQSLMTRLALRAARARKLAPGAELRLRNVASGLAADTASPAPELWVSTRPERNALVCGGKHPVIAVTRSLLAGSSRTELEAVLAHCLVRFGRGDSARALRALARGPFGRPPAVGYEDDVLTAALTRYPPALVRALRSAEPVEGRYGPLWFVSSEPSHRSVPGRIAALKDL
ncbi:hypothetical protein BH18ACT15_BH18ACT15_12940 [soil metagenome]